MRWCDWLRATARSRPGSIERRITAISALIGWAMRTSARRGSSSAIRSASSVRLGHLAVGDRLREAEVGAEARQRGARAPARA